MLSEADAEAAAVQSAIALAPSREEAWAVWRSFRRRWLKANPLHVNWVPGIVAIQQTVETMERRACTDSSP